MLSARQSSAARPLLVWKDHLGFGEPQPSDSKDATQTPYLLTSLPAKNNNDERLSYGVAAKFRGRRLLTASRMSIYSCEL